MSVHFSRAELTHSNTATAQGIDNTPNAEQAANLDRLADELLEPIRALFGVPILVTVGFRSQALNAAVGGVPNSEHCDGRAADFVVQGVSLMDAFAAIRLSSVPYHQLILESGCIHCSIAPVGEAHKHEALIRHGFPGNWQYETVN